ncbi:TonB-dependent receptor family protein [Arenimonas sp. MALMAid1274]|uniref:TonB-dependent receptor family protein n=1 Tax=Arenimonas sp. MALMAid1274 TaxID=3411630 RepID=UPI003BA3AA10
MTPGGRAAWGLALCALAPAAAGQQTATGPGSAPAAELAPVVVTATREADEALQVPAAIDVIDARQLSLAQPRLQLSESLQRVPGVVARDRNNYAQDLQISIRGYGARASFGVRGLRLYTDGIPATMPDGQGQVSHFALESAQRIEVLRGPFSALYGNSSGGVISVFSADPSRSPQLSLGQVLGSDGLRRSSVSAQGPLGTAHGVALDAGLLESDGYRDHSAARRLGGQALFKGGWREGTRYTLLVNHVDLRADDPQGLTSAQLDGDRRAASAGALAFDTRKTVTQTQAGLALQQDLSLSQGLALVLHAGQRDTFQMLSVPVAAQGNPLSGGGAIDLAREYGGIDLRWQWAGDVAGKPASLSAGLEHQFADERRRGFENFIGAQLGVVGRLRRDEGNRVSGRDAYVQADFEPGERWRLNAGLRRSRVRFESDDDYVQAGNPDDSGQRDYGETSPVAGVLFRATPSLSLYANTGRGFETPTFAELAYRSDGGSGLNAALRPARSRSHELGLRLRREGLDADLALFQSRTRDELVVVSNQGGRSVFGNAADTRRRGLELSLARRWDEQWQFAAAYTWLDARYLQDVPGCGSPPCAPGDRLVVAGRQLPGLSRHYAWAQLRWQPRAGTDLVLEGRHASRVFANDANSAGAPAYTSVDLGLERRLHWGPRGLRVFARVNNVFDREVIGSVIVNEANGRYFEPAPGRHWLLGLSLDLATRKDAPDGD